MSAFRTAAALAAVVGLGACAGGTPVSRSESAAPMGFAAVGETLPGAAVLAPRYDVREVRVTVPADLEVSEANSYYPIADIVWRGEARGDRHEQVRTIFMDAFGFGTVGMRQGEGVIVEATVRRFHALTEKTRYTVGGVHAIRFELTVRDAATGAILDGPRLVVADLPARGGRRAIAEEQAGRTQRVVIVESLAQVIRRQLSVEVAAPVAGAKLVTPATDPVSQGTVDPGQVPVTGQAILQTVQMSL